ncbi:MAG: hypothetical protein KF821_01820 [Anaerolineales bacterium]|jgi:hypothetical protein|nr:hypothetical protein [Anaerolineales bacterium]
MAVVAVVETVALVAMPTVRMAVLAVVEVAANQRTVMSGSQGRQTPVVAVVVLRLLALPRAVVPAGAGL